MGTRRREYTIEFKREALELLKRSPDGVTEVAKQLGIPAATLGMWESKLRRGMRISVRQKDEPVETIDEEVRRLRRENEQLKLERDFLKKAAAFFAKESK